MKKYFPQDKNYILYGAQIDQEEELIRYLADFSRQFYEMQYNPLGLIDDTILEIRKVKPLDISLFSEFYEMICAIYRYKYGNNQLEFLFDGMDHYTKYSQDWKKVFEKWLIQLFSNEGLLKTVLQLCVFEAEGHSRFLAMKRLNTYLCQHFNLKIYRHRGIIDKAA